MKPEKTEKTSSRSLSSNHSEARQMAVAEVESLNDRYGTYSMYSFEHAGRSMSGDFVQACLEVNHFLPNSYLIELAAPHGTVIDGDCLLTDSHGRRVEGQAITIHGTFRNMIIIRTSANNRSSIY